jgi:RNA polymerase sigma factor (sigma-70 family)
MQRRMLPWAEWVAASGLAQASDTQLLYRYARLGEQSAFTVLVKRHGPLVYGVCRRVLRTEHDAEDAFQATFLVLAKKAASLRQPAALVSWLYGVAYRTACQLRRRRRAVKPLEAAAEPATVPVDTLAWQECGTVIDEAILQLPAKLRTVFLLCEAEELTTLAASRRLGVPEGTVFSRLHRARQQLQRLLAHRGITSTAGALLATGGLVLPEALAHSTTHAILAATVPVAVASLAQGVLSIMFWTKIATAAVVTVSLGVVGVGSASLLGAGPGATAKSALATTVPMDDKDRQIEQLRRQLLESRDRELQMRQQMEQIAKEQQATKDFLQQTLSGVEKARNNELKQREQAENARQQALLGEQWLKEADKQVRLEAEIQAKQRRDSQERNHKMKAEKLQQYQAAREVLAQETDKLYAQLHEVEQERQSISALQRLIERQQVVLEEYSRSLRQVKEEGAGDDSRRVKVLIANRDSALAEIKKAQADVNKAQHHPMMYERLKAQLQMREKLLLEVEEKLLRAKLGLE